MRISTQSLSTTLILIGIVCYFSGVAVAESSGIPGKEIEKLVESFPLTAQHRALMNAVTNNDLQDLALNRDIYVKHDDIFSFTLDNPGITNQKSSGRCWLFAGFNVLRPGVMKKYNLSGFEFSENHLFFWDKLEKANMFLEAVIETRDRNIDDRELQALIDNPVPDGGWWNYFVALVDKYGVVPQEVSPETKHTSDTRKMNAILNRMMRHEAARLRELASRGTGVDELREIKFETLKDVYRILALHMGVPPSQFTWRCRNKDKEIIEENFTPQSFYREAVGIDLTEYVTIFDYPVHEYDKFYRINFCRGMTGQPDMGFINLPVKDLKEYACRAVRDNEPVWFAADIGKENYADKGVLAVGMYDYNALLGIERELSKKELLQFRGGSPNHAMVFTGVDGDESIPHKWLVENSWGSERGNKGLWTMYGDWFDRYVFGVIVHRKHLPKRVIKLLDTEPRLLPAWDPMRVPFEQ
ncbi:MAG: C1 family peptidase [Candidatus Krumholzibacteriota bacterium]|nr:C1 family peptidase [Candidatus Krumholzibacteriota bacterium]